MMEMLGLLPEHSMLSRLFLGELVFKHIDVTNICRNSHTGQQEFLTQGGLAVLASALADEAAGRDKVVMIYMVYSLITYIQPVVKHALKDFETQKKSWVGDSLIYRCVGWTFLCHLHLDLECSQLLPNFPLQDLKIF